MKRFALCVLMICLVGCGEKRPNAFSGDILTIVESCASSNMSVFGTIVGSQIVNTKTVDEDGILRCLYASGVTVSLNGDPIIMRTVTP